MLKRRFRSVESGALFVPRVDGATIEGKVRSGEWVEVAASPAPPAPTPRKRTRKN